MLNFVRITIALAFIATVTLAGGFTETCSNLGLNGTYLTATCESETGAVNASIDLNTCLGVDPNRGLACPVIKYVYSSIFSFPC